MITGKDSVVKAFPADEIQIGDYILTAEGESRVKSIGIDLQVPISPQTTLGTIIVNNVTMSTLTKYDEPESLFYINFLHKIFNENNIDGHLANIIFDEIIKGLYFKIIERVIKLIVDNSDI